MNEISEKQNIDIDAVVEKIQLFTIETPFELFCIFNEIIDASAEGNTNAGRIAYMIDQSLTIELKIEAMIQSVYNIQIAYAKALLVDRAALCQAQRESSVLEAYRILQAAYET